MGNEWWGRRDGSDHDSWQANWDNQLSSKEHRAVKQGYRENKQDSEEDSLGGKRRYYPLMGLGDGRLYFIPLRLWFRVIDLGADQEIEISDAPNDASELPKLREENL